MSNINSPNKGGRPLKFSSVKTLQAAVNAYFKECDPHWTTEDKWVLKRNKKGSKLLDKDGQDQYIWKTDVPVRTVQMPYTITGLAVHLGTTRETLMDYEKGNRDLKPDDEGYDQYIPKFSDTIKAAKQKCQEYAERSLYSTHSTGAIFNLKNNYDWKDKSQVEESGEKKVVVVTRRRKSDDDRD